MASQPLLDASGVAKRYGAVAALRNASLSIEPGEVHALMGANGAGKSTLVKILTGAVRPDAGRILIRGEARALGSPAAARRAGLVPVYQEPSLVPDLDVADNLRLTGTPVEPFRAWVRELGVPDLDLGERARDIPLAVLRVLDLARALAAEPDVLLLDEMTAALPADLAERVMAVVRGQSRTGRSVIFISHRFVEISALCDRATVLRDGETVGVVAMAPGAEERIVELMLGSRIVKTRGAAAGGGGGRAAGSAPRLSVRNLQVGTKLADVSLDLGDGEVAGVVALEGQGQDELFGALAGSIQPSGGTIEVDGRPVRFGHPADAIRAGIAYVPGDRSDALLMHRSVRENIALPFSARLRRWGPIAMGREQAAVAEAIRRLQIDTRAQREVQRLSGGNQQKVTIARWIAAEARTILCFDPTRGIDVGTKQEIYRLLRDLAGQGRSVLFYTSELEEVQRVCDRAIVIFGGRVVDILPAEIADEAALTRAAYGLRREATEEPDLPAAVADPSGGPR
ncbi:sugar ABC transporter ATP-binding protein [Labrys wisconsinensis]|uniref:Ribose transport system ATP-binding protein n=1 Tax=Labrys wisconsinensis TaxID=425677 RepID=A0ABU0JC45_9HYPH|nr:sugar ABC transporter ATP-binding protein [Labrys wisconsinensis]MDQ0471860.1 ribose transport system ATP-binding protein [Labrys wisconsinensis]